MSAFVGLLLLNGAPCPQPVVESMLTRLRHRVDARGWAGAQVRCHDAVGLGYAPRLSAPQSLSELERPDACQTLLHNGLRLWITSDVRLDGRAELAAELAAELGLDAAQAREWPDGRLVLEAYARFGRETPAHLRGDFAFAIWDEARHRLFCARDRFGTKPFYYAYKAGQFFAFANEIKALWPVPGLDAGVNETQIANYLLSRFDDKTSTFYASVRRLSPASWVEIEAKQSGELHEHLYWELDANRELILPRDEDYAAMLREGFTQSVRERMRSDGPCAVFLSGGLDSSSIAAVAERGAQTHQKPLPTFSTFFDRFSECDEREFINQTLARGQFEPMWMNGDEISPLHNMERLIWHLDQPPPGPNSCSAWAQYGLLGQAGFGAVLDGHGGDEVVYLGYERVAELLRQGDLGAARREMRLLARHGLWDQSPWPLLWQGLLLKGRKTRGLGRIMAAALRIQNRRLERREARRLHAGAVGTADGDLDIFAARLLHPEFARRFPNAAPEAPARGVREAHLRALNGALQPLALEIIDAMAGAYAIESRCPFWEQNLVEMCLAFPSAQKLRNGFNRYAMRSAMEGILAPAVQWRAKKTDFAPQAVESLRTHERQRINQMLESWQSDADSEINRYIDLEEVKAHWTNLQNAPEFSTSAAVAAISLWKVLALAIWLEQQKPLPQPLLLKQHL